MNLWLIVLTLLVSVFLIKKNWLLIKKLCGMWELIALFCQKLVKLFPELDIMKISRFTLLSETIKPVSLDLSVI